MPRNYMSIVPRRLPVHAAWCAVTLNYTGPASAPGYLCEDKCTMTISLPVTTAFNASQAQVSIHVGIASVYVQDGSQSIIRSSQRHARLVCAMCTQW